MLLRNLGPGDSHGLWQQLSDGVPMIAGLASLCSRFIAGLVEAPDELSAEALALLVAARDRGMLEIRVAREPFDSLERLAAVCVELDGERYLAFRQKSDPRQTLKFLDAFRELCQAGMVTHHSQKDFSLTEAGFQASELLSRDNYAELIEFAEVVDVC